MRNRGIITGWEDVPLVLGIPIAASAAGSVWNALNGPARALGYTQPKG